MQLDESRKQRFACKCNFGIQCVCTNQHFHYAAICSSICDSIWLQLKVIALCRTSWINTCHNIAEILLKLALNTNQAINHGKTEKFKVLNLIFRYLKLTLTNNIGKCFFFFFFSAFNLTLSALLSTGNMCLHEKPITCFHERALVFTSELIEV